MFGKLLSLPFRLVNVPLKIVDEILLPEPVVSVPLDVVADAIEEVLDDQDK